MLINETNYIIPELNFNAMCRLEDMGVPLTEMDKKVMTAIRGFLALAMDGDLEKAGKELEAHLEKGGNLDQILKEINLAVENSGFFQSLAQNAQTKSASNARGEIEEATPDMNPSER